MLLINQREIVVDALKDYKKYFDDNSEQFKHIDQVLKSIQEPYFCPITSISKEDIVPVFNGDVKVKLRVKTMDKADMKPLASDLTNDYCEQLFWESLKIIFEFKLIKEGT